LSYYLLGFWFVVLWGGEINAEGLSETIKAAGMRERKKEGHYSGKRIKKRMRGE